MSEADARRAGGVRRPARAWLSLAAALAPALAASCALACGSARAVTDGGWSAPATLSACGASAAPSVVFPESRPGDASGPGAIVWGAARTCPGGAGARVAAIGSYELPGAPAIPRTASGRALVPQAPLSASAAPHGEILIAGTATGSGADGMTIQGQATGPFAPLTTAEGTTPPLVLTDAYLGDVALASPPAESPPASAGTAGAGGGSALNVHVERFFAHGFVRNASVFSGTGDTRLRALAVAMDFRSDAVAVWAREGALYARDMPARSASHRIQRLATVRGQLHVAALLSDDNRAIVVWSEQQGAQTNVYIDRSAVGVRFAAPVLLERFQNPGGLATPPPRLVRLSSESVMLAWAGVASGHWVVRVAPVDLQGVRGVSTIAAPSGDALLDDLAPGPDGDALLLWSEPQQSAAGVDELERQALFAARGVDSAPERVAFGEPQRIAPPGQLSQATVALDPRNDRAVAAWEGAGGAIDYAIGSELSVP